MSPKAKKWALIAACGLLVAVPASRIFYLQEMFFALVLFAAVFLLLLLLACLVAGVWIFYEKAVTYLALWAVKHGHRALLPVRARLLELAPAVSKTAGNVSAARHTLFHPFADSLRALLLSFRQDASRFRADAERAIKHLRLLLKHG